MNLQTPCWKIGIYLSDMPVVSILLFPRAVMKQFINWLMNIIFWNTFRNLSSFSACKPRVNKVLKTFGKNFMRLTSMVFVGQSQHAPSYATSPSSKIIFQRINVASMWNRTFFFHYCDQSAMIYLNWCLWYQTINYDRVSSIFLSKSTWLHIKSVIDGTNQWASLDELRK